MPAHAHARHAHAHTTLRFIPLSHYCRPPLPLALALVPHQKQVRVRYIAPPMDVTISIQRTGPLPFGDAFGDTATVLVEPTEARGRYVPIQLISHNPDVIASGLIFTHIIDEHKEFLRMRDVHYPVDRAEALHGWINNRFAPDSRLMLN